MPVSDYTPDVTDVARFIRARTKTQGGAEAGTFNPEDKWSDGSGEGTRPSAQQVTELIQEAMDELSPSIAVNIPDAPIIDGGNQDPDLYRKMVKRVFALKAALLTELNFWPEQINTGRSTYPQLLEQFKPLWESVLSLFGLDANEDGIPDQGGIEGGYPSYGGFPGTAIGMETPW